MKNTDKDCVFILFIYVHPLHRRFNFLILQNSTDRIALATGGLAVKIDFFRRP
jgi:hypothetical protein